MSPPVPSALHQLLRASEPAAREDAWAALVAEHSRLLLKVASAKRGGYDATMDRYAYILDKLREQEFRRLRSYQSGAAKFSTWLVVVARRLCTDFSRERYGRPTDPGEAESIARRSLADLASAAQVNEELLQAPDDVGAALDVVERDRLLACALAGLPAEDRLLVRLRYEDGISVQEIRAVVGLPTVFHVYRRLKAIHERLRAALERGGLTRAAG